MWKVPVLHVLLQYWSLPKDIMNNTARNWKCWVFQMKVQLVLYVIKNNRSAVSKLMFLQPFLKKLKKKHESHLFYLNSTYSSFSSFRMPIAFAYPSSENLILTFQFFFFWKKWTVLCLCSYAMGIAQGKWHISATKYNTTDIITIFSKCALKFWQHPQGLLLYISLS